MSTAIGPTDRDRFSDEPVLSFFHPEGYVSQQKGQQGRMELEDNDFVGMVVEMVLDFGRVTMRQETVKSVVERVCRFNGDKVPCYLEVYNMEIEA